VGNGPTLTSHGERERAEVDSALGSAFFARSPRLANLLKYVCEKYFAGETDQIKEYNIAVDVLDRPPSFDPSEDAIARVEVHRLRKKLREYYETEGADHSLRIVIPIGRYVPVFLPAEAAADADAPTLNGTEAVHVPPHASDEEELSSLSDLPPPTKIVPVAVPFWKRTWALALTAVALCAAGVLWLARTPRSELSQTVIASRTNAANGSAMSALPAPSVPPLAGVATPGVRILCGRHEPHSDRWGRLWSADKYFEGGNYWEQPRVYLARTFDPTMFQGSRTGNFSYQIPLEPGVYELHLYFVETTFGPPNNGGENSRQFHVAVDRRGRILSEFDIISDAGGPGIVDERVFKDISPGPDGLLRIRFMTVNYMAMVSAIEVEPARANRLNPIRLVAQDRSYTDAKEHVWFPENYWLGGQAANHSASIEGTEDPGLYSRERYGNFSYAIPVDEGEYAVTLHFAETYWGRENPGGGGAGIRVFDVFCNGVALFRNLDIYKDVGADRPLVKTFHHMKPNAQGKLLLSFVPVHNFATVSAIEVEDETKN
jgi:hypothetical protein